MASEYSEAKRKLLEKCLRGEVELRPRAEQIPRRRPGERVPLSHAQEQVWMHAQLAPELPLYNEPVTIHHSGPLDVGVLERSFNEILRRHEAWRTTFRVVEGQPFQEVHEKLSISFPITDLRGLAPERRDAAAIAIATAEASVPIDLAELPLFRARLIRLDEEEYRLYLTLSHIIFDGVAIYGVFLPELIALYKDFSAGQPSSLPELPFQYPDYACWARQTFNRESLAKNFEYWREQLSGPLPEVYLPTDSPISRRQTFRGSMYPFVLDKNLTARLRQYCRNSGVSLFHALLAGFAALLYRYSGEERIPIGGVTAGRNLPGTESLLGYFLNTVVFPADLTKNPSFRILSSRARDWTIDALDHDRVPFEHLVRELRVQRDPGRNPWFQALFSLEPPMPEIDPAWRLTQMDVDTGATKYDLYLELDERSEEVLARFHYNTDLFERGTIERMLGHFQHLIAGAVENPDTPLAELSIMSEEERRQVLVEWNQTAEEYPRELTIPEAFEQQVERTPQATGLIRGGKRWSYEDINGEANRLGHWLRKQGIGEGCRVGICLERSVDMVVALLGVLKSGAAYVPLDPGYPRERLQFMMEDAALGCVITQAGVREKLPRSIQKIVVMDEETEWRKEASSNLGVRVGSDEVAYVIYTSGSTGNPKGVEGTHRGSMNRFAWMWKKYPFQGGEVCCQKTNLGFVDSIWEIFGPLLGGVPSVMVSEEAVRDPEQLVEELGREGVTRLVLVPSLLRAMLEHAPNLQERLPGLRLWSCSGEILPVELARKFREVLPEAKLLNIYGSSEVAADVTWHEVEERDLEAATVAIGRPISNTQIYLLDERGQAVAAGVRGEIYVGGEGLARGYWKRPELTAERFVVNEVSPEQSARLYRTGDVGRYRTNGDLEYLGRVDQQVKLRGQRIELGEIEAVLGRHGSVRQAVVAVTGTGEQQKLTAYLELKAGAEVPKASELRQQLRAKLPEAMVPSSYWRIEQVPLLPSGKVNRGELRRGGGVALGDEGEQVGPRNEVEAKLGEIWRELLKVEQVGMEQNFFELGGHSLLVLQLTARIRRALEVELPVRSVFEAPTIAGLALEVEKARALGLKPRTPIVQLRPRTPAGVSREALLAQLDGLSSAELQGLLQRVLDGKSTV